MKKITIKDIAREAGVSVATVSYVLNNRTDQKISEPTKAKVLQIVNLFNYQSGATRNLAANTTKTVAIFSGEGSEGIGAYSEWHFISALRDEIAKDGYHLTIEQLSNIRRIDDVDAIICHGTTVEFFREIAQVNFVPIIAVDLYVNDTLFFQINSNYRKIVDVATKAFGYQDFTLVVPAGLSPQLRSVLRRTYTIKSVENLDELKNFLNEMHEAPVVVFGEALYDIAKLIKTDVVGFPVVTPDKMFRIWESCKKAIGRLNVSEKHFEVS